MPEEIIEKIRKNIKPQWIVCFVAALLAGFAAHFYKLTNWIPNWDSLVFRYDGQNMIGLGRWFLPVVCSISSFYDLPFLNGIICILFHAAGAVVICRMFDIKKGITAFLIGATVVTFPAVTSVLMYNYVADGYAISFFMACLAAELMTREKPHYVISAILIALSVGIYQAYITVTVVLLVLFLADSITFKGEKLSKTAVKAVKFFACGLAGMLLYYGILKILLLITGESLIEYQGINSAGMFSSLDIPASLYTVKETFMKFFFDFSVGVSLFSVTNIAVALITAVCYVRYAVSKNIAKTCATLVVHGISVILMIMGGAVLAFINPEADYHSLMLMGYIVFYLSFIILYERGEEKKEKNRILKTHLIFFLTLVLIFNQIVIANVSYHKAQMAYEKSFGVLTRIQDRIEQTENSDKCKRIMVIGTLADSEDYSVTLPPEITGVTDGFILRFDDETVGQSVVCSAINDYCGKNYEFVSGDEKEELLEKEEIRNMKVWPQKGSILVTDDIVVIKLGAEEEK